MNQLNSNQRCYSRQRITRAGDYYSMEIETVTDESIHHDEKLEVEERARVAEFIEDDEDLDLDITFRANEQRVDALQERVVGVFLFHIIVDCVVYDIQSFSWHCSSCKAAGVRRCGLVDSCVMTARAIVNHILSCR